MFHVLEDTRVNCTSIMTCMTVAAYLAMIDNVYKERGGIEGQRAPLKTKTALTIRKRMVSDLQVGGVIPPLVIGVLVTSEEYHQIRVITDGEQLRVFFAGLENDRISIIDGMQRTTALKEATTANEDVQTRVVRIEFWVTEFVSSLIYRMLILNTGQVPWELSRQLETVYSQFLRKISKDLAIDEVEIFQRNDQRRRVSAGQYQGSSIVELLLIFSSRKTEIDLKDRVAEDFARIDAIETSAHAEFVDYFIEMLRCLARLDKSFSKLPKEPDADDTRLSSGKDIFGSFPSMAGFAAAVSVYLFDEPGFSIDWAVARERIAFVTDAVGTLESKLDTLSEEELREFLQLQILEERLSGRRGGVGRYEREFFRRAFSTALRNAARLDSMAPCWLAS